MRRIYLNDTTLRDGEQPPGVAFSAQRKVRLAMLLDEAGVDGIEVGTPAMGGQERDAVEAVCALGLKARVSTWNRSLAADVRASLECGARHVHIALPVSDRQLERKLGKSRSWALGAFTEAALCAREGGAAFTAGAEDASRADEAFLLEFAQCAAALGAERLRYADTVGVLEPLGTWRRIRRLCRGQPLPVEIHTHNDFGLATANSLAAVHGGAAWVSVTVNGLGERAGNAALEEVALALRHLGPYRTGVDLVLLRCLARAVARASRRALPPGKPVVGTQVFTHEAGIHVDGILRDPATYEPFDPAEVGGTRRLVLGKHTGSAALAHILTQAGMRVSREEARELLPLVRESAIRAGGSVDLAQLRALLPSDRPG